jgi:hypothetical protein
MEDDDAGPCVHASADQFDGTSPNAPTVSPIHMHEAAIDGVQYAFMWMCSRPYGK